MKNTAFESQTSKHRLRTRLRLFFTLPRAWTDHVLPLEASRPAEIERVMIGRIELISPAQHELLQQIAAGPTSNAAWYFDHFKTISPEESSRVGAEINKGAKSLKDLGFHVPADYQAYVDLGRFRDALVLNEAHHSASPHLQQFVRNYRLPFLDKPLTVRPATRPPLE